MSARGRDTFCSFNSAPLDSSSLTSPLVSHWHTVNCNPYLPPRPRPTPSYSLPHFGYQLSEHHRTQSPVENWYNSLIINNARWKGELNIYADLDGKDFVHPTLLSVSAFLDGLIAIFGDKFMKENANWRHASRGVGPLVPSVLEAQPSGL
ncbi:hypothetical protein VP01_1019g2 [Puccinia sorghi]|uniref:Uncharacterized protein n=1 Tax=Puccinia sorghi TaxID=27349 RepID=A0A0L6VUY0_9BASI|nr:hypothetical protein VP01_1019g2 [Puccinia sorghi]